MFSAFFLEQIQENAPEIRNLKLQSANKSIYEETYHFNSFCLTSGTIIL